ncbi:hypothetical protein RSAG8_06043, partial [Rhizoctonia solani AG-8 WAC10335]
MSTVTHPISFAEAQVVDSTLKPWGVLIGQTKREVYSKPGHYYLHEVVEVYIKRIGWRESELPHTNHTESDVELEMTDISNVSIGKGTDWSANAGISATIKVVEFKIGGDYGRTTSYQEGKTKAKTTKVTIKPGQTLYRYCEEHKLMIRTWWIGDAWGVARVVTGDNIAEGSNRNSLVSIVEVFIPKGARESVVKLTGKENLDVLDIEKKWDDSDPDPKGKLARSHYSHFPHELREAINNCWKKASGF